MVFADATKSRKFINLKYFLAHALINHLKVLLQKNGPDKNGPAGPILDEKLVWPDQYLPTKYSGPA